MTHEVALYPLAHPFNQNFAQHTGMAASYTLHLSDGFGRVLRQGRAVDAARPMVTSSCRVDSFEGQDAHGRPRSNSVPLAMGAVRDSSSGVQHLVSVYAGAGFTF